jgi:hypothetical protein
VAAGTLTTLNPIPIPLNHIEREAMRETERGPYLNAVAAWHLYVHENNLVTLPSVFCHHRYSLKTVVGDVDLRRKDGET